MKQPPQTLDELNLLGKFRRGSVYHLFNQVKTRGGEQLLDAMFRHPLTDATSINERSNTFRDFQQANISFPFDVQQVNLMREYLDIRGSKNSALVLAGTLMKKWLSSLTRDERFKKNVQGLQATIVTLNKCYGFTERIQLPPGSYATRVATIKSLLSDKKLEKLRNTDIYQSLSVQSIA